jgi:hypothetical protein
MTMASKLAMPVLAAAAVVTLIPSGVLARRAASFGRALQRTRAPGTGGAVPTRKLTFLTGVPVLTLVLLGPAGIAAASGTAAAVPYQPQAASASAVARARSLSPAAYPRFGRRQYFRLSLAGAGPAPPAGARADSGGGWGKAEKVRPGSLFTSTRWITVITSLSCASAGNCSAGGYYDGRPAGVHVLKDV